MVCYKPFPESSTPKRQAWTSRISKWIFTDTLKSGASEIRIRCSEAKWKRAMCLLSRVLGSGRSSRYVCLGLSVHPKLAKKESQVAEKYIFVYQKTHPGRASLLAVTS